MGSSRRAHNNASHFKKKSTGWCVYPSRSTHWPRTTAAIPRKHWRRSTSYRSCEPPVELARPSFEGKAIRVQVVLPDRLAVRAGSDKLAQVLANLLQNASRFTPEGGLVTLAAEARRSDVLVSVTNSGQAIPQQDLPHVFERFYRVEKSRDRARGGAGIGLAIVKQLVEGIGGRVGAESDARGTRFWFSLPA